MYDLYGFYLFKIFSDLFVLGSILIFISVLFSDLSGSIADTLFMIWSSVCLCGRGRMYKTKGH